MHEGKFENHLLKKKKNKLPFYDLQEQNILKCKVPINFNRHDFNGDILIFNTGFLIGKYNF